MTNDQTTPATAPYGLRMRRVANELTPEQVHAPLEHGEEVRLTVRLDGNRTVQVWGRPKVTTTTVGNAILQLEITDHDARVYDTGLREAMMDIADMVPKLKGTARKAVHDALTRLAQVQPLDGEMPAPQAPDA